MQIEQALKYDKSQGSSLEIWYFSIISLKMKGFFTKNWKSFIVTSFLEVLANSQKYYKKTELTVKTILRNLLENGSQMST